MKDPKDPVFARADMHDNRVVVMLNAELHIKSRDRAESLDLSQSAYIRRLIIEDLKRSGCMGELCGNGQGAEMQGDAQILHSLARLLRPYL